MNNHQKFIAFFDESGVANLNDATASFILSMIIIEKDDFKIIEGYFQLLKRKFFKNDFKLLHATDLFERTAEFYPELKTTREINAFTEELGHAIQALPFAARLYHVNKDAVRSKHGYVPVRGKKPTNINIELPYEIAARAAINQFTEYLIERDAKGEMVIESRLFNDYQFVRTFDDTRKESGHGGAKNPLYAEVEKRITSLLIANKEQQNGGLELADLGAYAGYRHKIGDPGNKLCLDMERLKFIFATIKDRAYKSATEPSKRFIFEETP